MFPAPMHPRFIVPVAISACLGLLACGSEDSDDGGSSSTGSSSTGSSGASSTGTSGSSSDAPMTDTGTSESPTGSSEGPGDDGSTAAPTGGVDATTGETGGDTTLPPPDMGFDAYCRRYIECGGTYYTDEQDCLDESYQYWGTCPERLALLEALGACVQGLTCEEFGPNTNPPSSTPCGQYYDDLVASDPCE